MYAEDLVLLQSGERVPADGILISGTIYVDQAVLNGESKEVKKLPGSADVFFRQMVAGRPK